MIGPPAFDRCTLEQKLVLLALKTQLTFKETAEVWSSRYYRCTAKYLSRAYKKLRCEDSPNQPSFTRNELERLQVIARPDEWMPDEHIIFMLLAWQSGAVRPWQTISDAFNERFYSNLSVYALSRFALRFLHDKSSSDYLLRPRARSVILTKTEVLPLALEIASMHVTTWSMSWISPFVRGYRKTRFVAEGEIPSTVQPPPNDGGTRVYAVGEEEEESPSTPRSSPMTTPSPAPQDVVFTRIPSAPRANRKRPTSTTTPAPVMNRTAAVHRHHQHARPTPEALVASRARLRRRLGLFLSTLYDYTDLTWDEMVRACPLGPSWNWLRAGSSGNSSDGSRTQHDCHRALLEAMVESDTPFPAADAHWADAFLAVHASGRSMFPEPNPRVLERLEAQMMLFSTADELLE
ncbi:MAG: hypothetical protein M1813_009468 [Trichoglossum hirsutum]|nr:MAG: hypothetical protein M1813_009468 [Trichoglossum hirsutum]